MYRNTKTETMNSTIITLYFFEVINGFKEKTKAQCPGYY